MHLVSRCLATWYSSQTVCSLEECDLWCFSCCDRSASGVAILVSFLRVRDVIQQVTQVKVRCNIGGMINLLCFADDMVLLAPAWTALSYWLMFCLLQLIMIDMKFNTNKTVGYVWSLISQFQGKLLLIISCVLITARDEKLKYVDRFKYLVNTSATNKDVSLDKEKLITFWKSIRVWIRISKFLKRSSTLQDEAFFHSLAALAPISGQIYQRCAFGQEKSPLTFVCRLSASDLLCRRSALPESSCCQCFSVNVYMPCNRLIWRV